MAEGERVRVGVLAPMKSELRAVAKAFALQPGRIDGVAVQTGAVGHADIVATATGMGTALATSATERLLDLGPFDRVVVVGIAGGVGPSVSIGDIVIPEVVFDGSQGTGYNPTPLDGPAARGSIVTSDDFIVDHERLADLIARGVIAVDMETGSVAAVCAAHGVAWSTVRAISDRAEDGDTEIPSMANPDGSPNARNIAKYFAKHPGRIPYMFKVGRGAMLAAKNAATTAARACARASEQMVDELPEEVDESLVADSRLHPGVIACIAVGGATGALARYGVSRVIPVASDTFPRATFVTNVAGAFVLGCFLAVMHERRWPVRYLRPLVAVGLLGAFTTFSTMTVETVTLVKDGDAGTGIFYLLLSVAVGLATCAAGVWLGRVTARPHPTGVVGC